MSKIRRFKTRLNKFQKRIIKEELWKISKKCGICGKDLPGLDISTLDHIIPLSKGGADNMSNLALTHWKCNNKKGNNI